MRKLQRGILDWIVARYPGVGLDKRAEFFAEKISPYLFPQSTVLDIGGGWGFYKSPLKKRGHFPVVLDVVCPSFQKAPVVIYDGSGKIPFSDKSFDSCLFITVLHHIKDPEAVVKEALRVTRKRVIVVEDVFRHRLGRLWTKWRDQILNFEYFGHPGMFKTKQKWIGFFEKFGLSCIEEKEYYTWLSGFRILNALMVFEIKNAAI